MNGVPSTREPGQATHGPRPDDRPPPRVLHVHRIAGVGGSERHLLTLLPALADRGVEVTMLGLDVPAADADAFYAELDPRVGAVRLPAPRDLDPLLAARVARAARRLRPGLVHTHLVHGDAYGAVAATACGAALVSTKHNDDPFRAGAFRHVERLLSRRADRVITISGAVGRFATERGGVPARLVEVIPYGLKGRADDEAPAPDAGGERRLLAIGRLVPQKGHDTAIRALVAVRGAHPGATLTILGDGPLRAELEALAVRLGVAGAVRFPGRSDDVAGWLRRSEVLVHPSRWEGFGLVLLEAMVAGRPVVAARVSAVPEVVEDGRTGVLVPPDDPAALAAALGRLLDDPEGARAMGRAGRERAADEFSVDRMADRTLALYRSVVAARR